VALLRLLIFRNEHYQVDGAGLRVTGMLIDPLAEVRYLI